MIPVDLEMIPKICQSISKKIALKKALQVYADGAKAKTFISVPKNNWSGDAKIVIVWEEPHKIFKQFFTTKYFNMNSSGKLIWGDDSETILLQKD